jgi:hypothetical protein
MIVVLIMIVVVLFARYICVLLPVTVLRLWIKFVKNAF